MATTFTVSRALPAPAAAAFALLGDRDYIARRARLDDDIGGDVVTHAADAARVELTTTAPFPRRWLGPYRSRSGEGPALTRAESWVRVGDGSLSGELTIRVGGVSARGHGTMTIRDDGHGGSHYAVSMVVEVGLPLVGRALEAKIAPRIERTATLEADDLVETLAAGG